MQRDFPSSLLLQLRMYEVCRRMGDAAAVATSERRVAELRAGGMGLGASSSTLPPADITVVDPIFRGSRLYYAVMLSEAALAAAPRVRVNLLTRHDYASELWEGYESRLSPVRLLPRLSMPTGMWYGRVPPVVCRQIVEAMVTARPGSVFAFAGLTEVLPALVEQIVLDGRSAPVHVMGYEYSASSLRDDGRKRALEQFSSRVRSLDCWVLDEGFDRQAIAIPGVDVAALPDPIPYLDEDPRLLAARSERSAFIDERRSDGRLALLAVGLQSSRKGLRDLIRAARVIEERRLPVRIYVSGKVADGEEELARQVEKLPLSMRSRATYVSDDEILRTYNSSDAVLLPYARDFSGSSGVFAHAMAFGKPVIATDHGCVGWRTQHFGVGLTYAAGDSAALVRVIETMLGWSDAEWRDHTSRCMAYYRQNSYAKTIETLGLAYRKRGLTPAVPAASLQLSESRPASASKRSTPLAQPLNHAPGGVMSNLDPAEYSFALDGAESIRQICLLDTGIGSRNMGDHIIVDSIRRHLRSAFPQAIFVTVPTHEYLGTESLKLIDSSDVRLVCGTNLLASHMDEYKQWKIGGTEFAALRGITLMGCGWWQYQDAPNRYTELLLRTILSDDTIHSVRDSYTAAKLTAIGGKRVLNTTCPTLWSLTPEHVASIPDGIAQDVVTTLTDYKADPEADRYLLDHLASRYRRVYVWIQGTGDFAYLKRLCASAPIPSLRVVPATLEAYDKLLASGLELDYIGTRLHAGVRALQHGRRSLILAVDNRAREISADTGLPCIQRESVRQQLAARLTDASARGIRLPSGAIRDWLAQFL
jgi:glycosyltransferase involved in cell wall biosynthesis